MPKQSKKTNPVIPYFYAFIIGILLMVVIGIFIKLDSSNVTRENNEKIEETKQKPKVTEQPIQETLKSTVIDTDRTIEKGKVYLTINMVDDYGNKTSDIYVTLPSDSTLKYQSKSGFISSIVTINNIDYSLSAVSGGRGGPCPMEDYGSKCGYDDETIIPLSKFVTINKYRVWHDEKGTFLLNPISLMVNGVSINHLEISKSKPNSIFTRSEVDLWKGIIESINSNL
jgi:hypothetical protein